MVRKVPFKKHWLHLKKT